jgi:hypothetical protein
MDTRMPRWLLALGAVAVVGLLMSRSKIVWGGPAYYGPGYGGPSYYGSYGKKPMFGSFGGGKPGVYKNSRRKKRSRS